MQIIMLHARVVIVVFYIALGSPVTYIGASIDLTLELFARPTFWTHHKNLQPRI